MKKKPRILSRFIVPVLLLFLLPGIGCLIFYSFALQEGRQTAEFSNHETICMAQELLEICFGADEEVGTDRKMSGADRPGTPEDPDPETVFLDIVYYHAAANSGPANLMILSADYELLHPHHREYEEINTLSAGDLSHVPTAFSPDRDFISPVNEPGETNKALADEIARAIRNGRLPSAKPFTFSDGEQFYVSVFRPEGSYDGIGYIIAFSSVSELVVWVRNAVIILAITSILLVLIILLFLRRSLKEVTVQINRLSAGAKRIGSCNFDPIEPAFSLRETEEIRGAINKMAGQLKSARGNARTFYANISHKLLTRLNAISGYAQALAQNAVSPEKAGATIRTESECMTGDVRQILSLSRLDEELLPVEAEPIPVIEILENCIDRCSEIGKQKGIALRLEKSSDELYAFGNEDLLEEILDNLLSNALRYAKSEIFVSVCRCEDGAVNKAVLNSGYSTVLMPEDTTAGNRIVLIIADDGDGIREEDLPHIFERFYKGSGGNLGLGLAISSAAAARMNGSLAAANRPEGGAQFTLILPAAGQELP